MKIYKVTLTLDAYDDLRNIYLYIAKDSRNNAEKFINYLEKEIYALEIFPRAFPQSHFSKFACFNLRAKIVEKDYLIVLKN